MHKGKTAWQFLLIYLLLLSGGWIITRYSLPGFSPVQYVVLLSSMTLITFGAWLLVKIGNRKNEKEKGLNLLAAIGGKFLAYLCLLLIFWATAKNLTKEFIIVFFVLYLVLTGFLLSILFKTLKSN